MAVSFGLVDDQPIKLGHLLADGLQSRQQVANRGIQRVVALRGRDHLLLEGLAVAPLQDGAEDLQQTPDLVLQVGLYADQLRPGAEHRADLVVVKAFDADFPVPAGAHDLRQAFSIIPVGLVDLHAEGGFGMPGINADHRQPHRLQGVPVPS
jgi:hypothetical protein